MSQHHYKPNSRALCESAAVLDAPLDLVRRVVVAYNDSLHGNLVGETTYFPYKIESAEDSP